MNLEQLELMKTKKGFIAALDQSGGSSAKTLLNYGVDESRYTDPTSMFNEIHKMRSRIIKSPVFTSEHILGVILFEHTMNNKINDIDTADYLWHEKGIIPFLKIDKGLDDINNGVQLMKKIPKLSETLSFAKEKNIFGTKMRSVIKEYNEKGIKMIVKQQFEFASIIYKAGLMPIIEPEVDINCPQKEQCEILLKNEVLNYLNNLNNMQVMFKFTIPTTANHYLEIIKHPNTLRVVALSGGYSIDKANELLKKNEHMIASFSRALLENLNVNQSEEDFNNNLLKSIRSIYEASINKIN